MKKLSAVLLALLFVLIACAKPSTENNSTEANIENSNNETVENKDLEVIKVASHTEPMTTILELISDDLEKEGYKLELVPVTDNVQANVLVNNKEADANFFQHEPFMTAFNKGNNGTLVKVTPVYNALVSFYGKDVESLDSLKDGAVVAVPNDPTNLARALRLLAKAGLIKLDNDGYEVTQANISENPKNLKINEWGLLNLNEAYNESDITFNYPTYIDKIGLKPTEDGLVFEEDGDQTFAISLVARQDNKDSEKIQALAKAINSPEVKQFIIEKLAGHANPSFN